MTRGRSNTFRQLAGEGGMLRAQVEPPIGELDHPALDEQPLAVNISS